METIERNPRRDFLGKLTASAVAGVTAFTGFFNSKAATTETSSPVATTSMMDADAWFNTIKGKRRIVFDATQPHEFMPFAWPRIFLITNAQTGSPQKDCSVVVVLRHSAIGYAFDSKLWEKYKFGDVFKAEDPLTKASATRNPFWQPKPGDYKIPGFGEVMIGINELQASGVMFCVCDVAMTVYSAAIAGGMNLDPVEVKKEWMAGLLPGIQVVPSGVWAVGRAQDHGCSYCFAG